MEDNELENIFRTEPTKVYTDIVFVEDLQHMVVKTWQKITLENLLKNKKG